MEEGEEEETGLKRESVGVGWLNGLASMMVASYLIDQTTTDTGPESQLSRSITLARISLQVWREFN